MLLKRILLLAGLLVVCTAATWRLSDVAVLHKPAAAGGGGGGSPGFRALLYAGSETTDTTDTRTFTNSASAGELVAMFVRNKNITELVTNITDSAGNAWSLADRFTSPYENYSLFYSVLSSPITGGTSTFTIGQSNVVYAVTTVAVMAITNATAFEAKGTNFVNYGSTCTAAVSSSAPACAVGYIGTEIAFPVASSSWSGVQQITGENIGVAATNAAAAGTISWTVTGSDFGSMTMFFGVFK